MTRRPHRWPLLLPLAVVTCQRPADKPPVATPAATSAEAPGDPPEPTPAADPTHPLELVPARARMMLMVKSPQRLAEIGERERFVGQFPKDYERLVSEMKREIGHDLLDPAALARIGVDPTGPAGIALVDLHDRVVVWFGTCNDPEALVAMAKQLSQAPTTQRTTADARVLTLGRELTLVLRHGMFAFVLVDRQREGQPDYPLEVARIDPARSLAHAPAMARGHAGLPAEADIQGLLDVAGLVRDELERERRFAQEMIADANRSLAEARQRGAPPEELEALRQQIQAQEGFVAQMRRRQQIAQMLLSRTLGSIEGIGLAANAEPHGLSGRIHVALTADSMFRDLLRSAPAPVALRALGDAPLLVASAHVSVDAAIELLAQMLLANSTSYAEANDEVRDDVGIDFDREIRPRLTGEASFVLTGRDPVDPEQEDGLERSMGGLLALGVSDEAAATKVIEQLSTRVPAKGWTPAPEIHGWAVDRREPPTRLWIGVGAGQVAIGTDRATIERLQQGQTGPAHTHFATPQPWAHLTEEIGVARLALHHRLPLVTLMGFASSFDAAVTHSNVDFVLDAEFPDDDIHSIPRSAKVQRLARARDEASRTMRNLRRRRREVLMIRSWNEATALGTTVGSIRHTPSGLMIEGGHYLAGGMGRYVPALLTLDPSSKSSSKSSFEPPTKADTRLWAARKTLEQAEQRLLKARRQEIQRALKRRTRSGGLTKEPR
ncbi:MAG: hypothetical protein AAGF11_34045 [Myxococcota bacterium]